MVHVPFFNVDLPEPKLAALIPDTVSAVIGFTAKAVEYGKELVHPPSEADLNAYERSFEATIPREFDRVRKRYAEGKFVNDEQLSSELEDASFDWYRRQLRTSVIGATDEEMEDVAARKLGRRKQSLQAAVQERCLADAVAEAGDIDLEAELLDAAEFQAMRDREEDHRRRIAERVRRISELRRQVRPAQRQAVSTISNASGGLLLGVLLAKSSLLLLRRILRRRKPQQRPPPQQRRQQPLQTAAAAASTAAQTRPQAATAAHQATAARQQGSSQMPPPPQQQQQEKNQGTAAASTSAASTSAAAAAARKPRAVKKR